MGTKQYDSATDLITFSRTTSATFLGSNGLLQTAANNVPRIEYDATGAVKGLLIEEARTNLVLNSGNLSTVLIEYNTQLVASGVTVPDGSTDAYLLYPDSSGVARFIYSPAQTLTAGATQTTSVYMKASGVTTGLFYSSAGGGLSTSGFAWFDLSAGTVGTVVSGYTATIEDVGNGWYRCSVSGVTLNGGYLIVGVADADNSTAVTKSGTDGILVWGAQAETGAFPTSYIPTTGAPATRARDIAEIPTSAFGYNNDKGTVVCEFDSAALYVSTIFTLVVDQANDGMTAIIYPANRVSYQVVTGGVTQVNSNFDAYATASQVSKVATVYAKDDFAAVLNGGAVATDTAGSVPPVSTLKLGVYWGAGDFFMSGHIKSIQYYPRRLTDTQLQELTT